MFSLAQRCVTPYKYIRDVRITERGELFKLKDSAGTRTNEYKQSGNKFSLEINIRFLKLPSSWISTLITSFSLALTATKILFCCYKVVSLTCLCTSFSSISFSVALDNLFVPQSLRALPPNSPVASSIAPESSPISGLFSPSSELHHHWIWNVDFPIPWEQREKTTECGFRCSA